MKTVPWITIKNNIMYNIMYEYMKIIVFTKLLIYSIKTLKYFIMIRYYY